MEKCKKVGYTRNGTNYFYIAGSSRGVINLLGLAINFMVYSEALSVPYFYNRVIAKLLVALILKTALQRNS